MAVELKEHPTPLKLAELAAGYFAEKGIESPRLEAEVLLAHVMGTERIGLYLQFDKPLSKEEVDAYRALVKRRGAGEPTAYVTGTREFWSLDFEVGPGVLVPRPDTELIVETVLSKLDEGPLELLELGVGSGAIVVALLSERARWRATGVDVDEGPLVLTRRNAAAHGVEDRLRLAKGDLYAPVAGERFDAVISNPPYIPSADIAGLEREVRAHEPMLALDGGADGLDVIKRIVSHGAAHLRQGGLLIFEFGIGQGEAVRRLLEGHGGYTGVEIIDDLTGRPRAALGFAL